MMMIQPAPTCSTASSCSAISHELAPSTTTAANISVGPLGCLDVGKCVNSCDAYGVACPLSAAAAGRAARLKMESILSDSPLFGGNPPDFRFVETSDVIMGKKLGTGGFCFVHACALKDSPLDESCAIKSIKPQIAVHKKSFVQGAADLVNEALFLGKLDHLNIVKLRAVKAGSIESNISSLSISDLGYFIVIDRLVETLEHRIRRWHSKLEEGSSSMYFWKSKEFKDKQRVMLLDRLQVAKDIANVMAYLHSLNLIYRDLKPDNCGFTRDGTLKLFDFGLCREATPAIRNENGKYRMTGHTGSLRYMATEIAKDEPYDKSVDVYSFGILLWEMCSLEKPYPGFCSKKHMSNVIYGGERPKMDHQHTAHWPVNLQCLMKRCWSNESKDRPTFEVVMTTLDSVMEELAAVQCNGTTVITKGTQDDTESAKKAPNLSHVQKAPRQRIRSLGLRRSNF